MLQRMSDLNPERLAFRGLWWAIGLGGVAGLVALSLMPEPPGLPGDRNGWLAHTLAYACLMGWFARLLWARGPRFAMAIGLVALGVAIEFAQGATGYRSFDVWDMAADGLGVLAGWLLSPPRAPSVLHGVDALLARALGLRQRRTQ